MVPVLSVILIVLRREGGSAVQITFRGIAAAIATAGNRAAAAVAVLRVRTYMLVPAARSTVQVYGDEVAVAMFSSWRGHGSALNTETPTGLS